MVANSELDADFKRMLAVWWLLAWRGTLVGALMGGLLGAVIGFVWYAMQLPADNLQMVTAVLGGLVGLVWGFIVLGMALRKKYKGFRIALVPAAVPA